MAKNDFQYAGKNSYTLQCGTNRTITTLISSSDCTLQCGMWLWNCDSEFTKWQHPAVWYVALGWHANKFAQTSAILEFYIWFPFPRFTAVDMSFCRLPVCEILSKSDHPWQKIMTSCRFSRLPISPILDCRSSIDTVALNCLVCEKLAFFFHSGDIQTKGQTDGQLRCTKPLSRVAA